MSGERPEGPPERHRGITRRRLLQSAGAMTAGFVVVSARQRSADEDSMPSIRRTAPESRPGGDVGPSVPPTEAETWLWSDPATWGGRVPGPGDVAVVSGPTLLDVDATVAGMIVEPTAWLAFDPMTSRSVETTGNVVVRGGLEMRPSSASVTHRLTFVGVDEDKMVGGGHTPLASDVGLWVIEDGVLDLDGTPKTAWTRAAGSIEKGADRVDLEADPLGWRVGDDIVITPTITPAQQDHHEAYDRADVTAVSGRRVALANRTTFQHPAVQVAANRIVSAEVLNLTRNVVIEGTPKHRTHIFIRSTQAQSLRYVSIRHVGPRRTDGAEFVLGRYGLHLHMCERGSVGSMVEGTVVHTCGSHAFVTHLSDGVTYRDCITHDTTEDAYWWDPATRERVGDPTNSVFYDRCVASLVQNGTKDFRLAGFNLGIGTANMSTNCVAVGVQGMRDGAGFVWPEMSDGEWAFKDCVSHNNMGHGILVWQNNANEHRIRDFLGYHNGDAGILHGAYLNRYQYEDSILYRNRKAAIIVFANSRPDAALRFLRVACDGGGISDYLIESTKHTLPTSTPTEWLSCSFIGYKAAAFHFSGTDRHLFDIVDAAFDANEFHFEPTIAPDSAVRVQDGDRGSIGVTRVDQRGTLRAHWNARVSPIDPFA